jgi:hypothetical protein
MMFCAVASGSLVRVAGALRFGGTGHGGWFFLGHGKNRALNGVCSQPSI